MHGVCCGSRKQFACRFLVGVGGENLYCVLEEEQDFWTKVIVVWGSFASTGFFVGLKGQRSE